MFVSFIGCCIVFVYLNQQNVVCFCLFYLYCTLVPHFQLRVWFVNKFICGWGFSCPTLLTDCVPLYMVSVFGSLYFLVVIYLFIYFYYYYFFPLESLFAQNPAGFSPLPNRRLRLGT